MGSGGSAIMSVPALLAGQDHHPTSAQAWRHRSPPCVRLLDAVTLSGLPRRSAFYLGQGPCHSSPTGLKMAVGEEYSGAMMTRFGG
jgi:hypothetical protein